MNMTAGTMQYDHFSNPSDENKGTGLWANIKNTKYFSGQLQITGKDTSNKGIPSAIHSTGINWTNAIAAPIVDWMNNISARAMNIIKTGATATVGHPIKTVKQNGFFKGGAKIVGTGLVGAAGVATGTASAILQAPAKIYEMGVNGTIQDGTDVMHTISDAMRKADKLGLKTFLPGVVDGAANTLKVLSKMGGYVGGLYALNWLGKYLNLATDAALEFVKLENVELQPSRSVINKDPMSHFEA